MMPSIQKSGDAVLHQPTDQKLREDLRTRLRLVHVPSDGMYRVT